MNRVGWMMAEITDYPIQREKNNIVSCVAEEAAHRRSNSLSLPDQISIPNCREDCMKERNI
jgi:hypothetical protein